MALIDPVILEELKKNCINEKAAKAKEEESLLNFHRECETIEYILNNERERIYKKKESLRALAQKREDLRDNQKRELRIRQEKFRHLLYENHHTQVNQQISTERKLLEGTDESNLKEREQQQAIRALLVRQKEQSQKHSELLFNLRLDQDKNITDLRETYMKKTQYLRKTYNEKIRQLRHSMEDQCNDTCTYLEKTENHRINQTLKTHREEFSDIKAYYNDITHSNLDLIKSLKGEVAETSKKEKEKEQQLSDVYSINKKYTGPLKQALEDIETLKIKSEYYVKDKAKLAKLSKMIEKKTEEYEELEWKTELLKEKILQKKVENEHLENQLQASLQNIQQTQGFKGVIAKEKSNNQIIRIEKIEATMSEILKRGGINQELFGEIKPFTEIMKEKDAQLKRLHEIMLERKERYYNTVHFYETAMKKHNVPLSALGFYPKSL